MNFGRRRRRRAGIAGYWLALNGLSLCSFFVAVYGCERESAPDARPDATTLPAPVAGETLSPVSSSAVDEPLEPEPSVPSVQADSVDTSARTSTPRSPAAADVPAWRPLADAAPGEWAEYETLAGQRLKYEILEVTGISVSTRITVRQAGRTMGEPAKREDDPQEDPLARQAQRRQAVRSAKTDWCEAAGRQWQATLYEDRWTDEEIQYVRRTWVSPRVPYHGILRMELYGDGQLEARLMLIDYGPR